MVTDRGRSYAAQACDDVQQQKCLAHIQRSISKVLERKTGRARRCGEGLQALPQDALQLWHADHDGAATDEAFTSVVRTLVKKGTDSLVQGLDQLFRRPGLQVAPP